MKSLKIIFSGTSEFSAQHLIQLIHKKYNIVGILTKPDKASGRGQFVMESPVKKIAKQYNIPIFQPTSDSIKNLHSTLYSLHADLMIVVAYGLIFPKNILNIFPLGCFNIHASLLPRWRGATPIQSAILNGDLITGISIIKMNQGIDTGKILYSSTCNIETSDTSKSLQDKLSIIGCKSILLVLQKLLSGHLQYTSQSKLTTYSNKIKKNDAKINWLEDAITIERCVRAFNPWPISFFKIHNQNLKVWKSTVVMQYNMNTYKAGEVILINKFGLQVQTKRNILNIIKIQLPGKKIMHAYNLKNCNNKWFKPKKINVTMNKS
ncbi:MAG: methionyl-tRNA formyltransferase [Buchnera aphidicola (Schlechtendalia peitan)]